MRNSILSFIFLSFYFYTTAHTQSLNDVVITEIMSDPSPSVGLPEVEYLEIYNRTDKPLSLKGWKLTMGSRSAFLPDSMLSPKSYMLLCHRNNIGSVKNNGQCIGLSTFLLTNEGSELTLFNQNNQLVYSINYAVGWWPSGKRNGGYALEMIDTGSPCLGKDNWTASIDGSGGTPGRINSVKGTLTDTTPLQIDRVDVLSETGLTVVFNKRIDSVSAVKGAGVELAGRKIVTRRLDSPGFRNLMITIDAPLIRNQSYTLSILNLADCAANVVRELKTELGLPVMADSGDVVINEILFNPREDGADFVELYNHTAKYVSIKNWSLGNMKDGQADVLKIITNEAISVSPNGFLAITTDPVIVARQYPSDKARKFLEISEMPAFSNEQGGVLVQDHSGKVLDRFQYSEKMHHVLIDNFKGVSLERIDPARPARDLDNWHSAASTVGYATPGYANSQAVEPAPLDAFVVYPEVFTPDQDGTDDNVKITYTQRFAGVVATVCVFDVNGRLIKNIIQNQMIGSSGAISWDGTDERQVLVKTGHYLILINTFDIHGNTKQYKKRVVAVTER